MIIWTYILKHGFARVAHYVPARWLNFSHYCYPLRPYDVFWAQRSTDRCADRTRCTQTRVYSARGKCIVRHWTSREATLRHSSGWGTSSVSPQYRDFRTRVLKYTFVASLFLTLRSNVRIIPENSFSEVKYIVIGTYIPNFTFLSSVVLPLPWNVSNPNFTPSGDDFRKIPS